MNNDQLETLRAEWQAALADSGFEVKQVRLYPFPGHQSKNGNHAYYFTPGQRLYYDADFPDDAGGQLEDANKHRDRHRRGYRGVPPCFGGLSLCGPSIGLPARSPSRRQE